MTSAAGISAIREAKKEGLDVTCGTSVHHLRWTDTDLDGFNRALRLHHPLRSEADRNALREAAMDGTLDVVVSDHRPRTPEEHDVDFMVVAPGIAGLHAVGPVLFGALMDHGATEADALDAMSRLLSTGPRYILDAGDGVSFFALGRKPVFIALQGTEHGIHCGHRGSPRRCGGSREPRGAHWN